MESVLVKLSQNRTLLAIALALSAFVGAFATVYVVGAPKAVMSVEQIGAGCGTDLECLANGYLSYMRSVGPQAAVSRIVELSDLAGVSCHNLSHRIGEVSYAEFPAEVFAFHEEQCGKGFTHGWMVAYADSAGVGDKASTKLKQYCNTAPAGSEAICGHGIGHALGEKAVDGSVAERVCRLVGGETLPGDARSHAASCLEGWVMQYRFGDAWDGGTAPVALSEELCAPVTGDLREHCVSSLFRRWQESAQGGPIERFALSAARCSAAEGLNRSVCYRHLGESIASVYVQTQHRAKQVEAANRYCSEQDSQCLIGQVILLATVAGAERQTVISDFCAALDVTLRPRCNDTQFVAVPLDTD